MCRGLLSPSGSNVCCCKTRNIFTWQLRSRSPISSRNIVPVSASSKRPLRLSTAPVKAPLACPNISLSKSDCDMPPRLTITNGLSRRLLLRCMACAISSFPVPFSPVISTEASVGATRRALSRTSVRALLFPIISDRSNASTLPVTGSTLSCNAVFTRCNNVLLSQGFVIKSNAPFFIPSTASGMLPHAVMSITGSSGWNILT